MPLAEVVTNFGQTKPQARPERAQRLTKGSGAKMKSELTVERILHTRARCGHELRVRSVGPAILLVIERDAPLRMEMLTNTCSEDTALREWLTSSPRAPPSGKRSSTRRSTRKAR